MEKQSTKDKILNAALYLFSEKGYDGTGVDLIAEKAGLKGPSLYKHFKGKEDILNSLIDKVEIYYESNINFQKDIGYIPESMDELIKQTKRMINFTMNDPIIKKTRRILTIEQFRNSKISQLVTKHNIGDIQDIYFNIFDEMMKKNLIKKCNSKAVAMFFTSPITLLIQMCDREPDKEQEVLDRIDEFLIQFKEIFEEK